MKNAVKYTLGFFFCKNNHMVLYKIVGNVLLDSYNAKTKMDLD